MGAEIPAGAVLVARAITNSSLWTMRAADRILAITCICMANWKPKKWFDGETAGVIDRGQFITSYEHLAEAAKLSIQNVRTSLRNLEKVGFLTRKVTRRWTLLTLCKYDHYQDMSKYYNTTSNSEVTDDQQAINIQLTTTKESNKGEEGKEVLCAEAKASTPHHHIPFELLEYELYAKDPHLCANWSKLLGVWNGTYPGVNVLREIKSAHSWQLSDPKRQKTKQARFIDNWLRRAQDNANRGGGASDFAMRRDANGPPKI